MNRACNLTERESQVMDLVVEGLTSKEIGKRIGISHKTVDIYMDRAREKMGVNNRAELAAQWTRAHMRIPTVPPQEDPQCVANFDKLFRKCECCGGIGFVRKDA